MYKFMIADDDKLVRERILSVIPAEKLELELCGEAEDGIQAIEIFETFRPQIVIVDINMPLLNGFEVAKRILQEDSDVNVIIVTGYGTLDFAKEAIRDGVADFLLKPIDFAELEKVLSKIVLKLQEQARLALDRQRMERLLERGIPLLRNKYFLSLMQTPADHLSEEESGKYLSDFGIMEIPSEICVAIIVPDYRNITVSSQMSMQAVLEDELTRNLQTDGIGSTVVYDSMQRTILIAYSMQSQLEFCLEQKISVLRDKMRYLHHLDFRASIGSAVSGFHKLQDSYHDAEEALGFWTILGNNNVVSSNNVKKIEVPSFQIPTMRHSEILDLLVAAETDKLRQKIDAYFDELIYMTRVSVNGLKLRSVEVVALLLSCARELGENVDEVLNEGSLLYINILNSNHVSEIRTMVLTIADRIVRNINGHREESKNRVLSDAKRYIIQNYSDPEITLTKVAESVNLSPSYISQLFKKNDNCTFTEYLNTVRINQAKKLLSSTHMRVYEVAYAVGYQNTKYFFQVFKQITGKRPREFYQSTSAES